MSSLRGLMLLVSVGALFVTAPNAQAIYVSETYEAGGGEEFIEVEVETTTATSWELQKSTNAGWETIQSSGNGFQAAQTFTIVASPTLQAGCLYRVTGNTSGTSGPYEASLTILDDS